MLAAVSAPPATPRPSSTVIVLGEARDAEGPFSVLLLERHGSIAFPGASAGLVPATDALFYFARWITPVTNPRRWDTRFLVARLPAGQEPVADGTETVSCTWMSPRAALGAYQAGRIVLIPLTVRTLDDLARFPSIDAVLADAAGRVVRAVTPELVQDGSLTAIRYPGNAAPPRRLVLQGGRWRPADD